MNDIDPKRQRLLKAAQAHMATRGREYRRTGAAADTIAACLALCSLDPHKKGLIDMTVSDIANVTGAPSHRISDILRREAVKENGLIIRAPSRKASDGIRYAVNLPILEKAKKVEAQKQRDLEQAKASIEAAKAILTPKPKAKPAPKAPARNTTAAKTGATVRKSNIRI